MQQNKRRAHDTLATRRSSHRRVPGRRRRATSVGCLLVTSSFLQKSRKVLHVRTPARRGRRAGGRLDNATQRPSGRRCQVAPAHLPHSLAGPLPHHQSPDPPRDCSPKSGGSSLCSAPHRTLHRHATALPLTTPDTSPQLALTSPHHHHHHNQQLLYYTTAEGEERRSRGSAAISVSRWRPSSCRRW